MTYILPGYVVEELFAEEICIEEIHMSFSALRYALRTKTIIWIL